MGLGFRTVPLLLAVASLLAACTRPFSYSPKTFALSLSPSSVSLTQGGRATPTLTLTPENGFTGTVALSLEGAPQGVSLSPQSVQVPGTPVAQPLTVSVDPGVAPGSYQVRVRSTSGNLTREADLALTVVAPSGDFSLTLESPSLSLTPGGTGYVRLSVNGSYAGPIALSLVDESGNPFRGVSLSPTSTPVPSAPMLELTASPSLAQGTYNLKVRGSGGGLVREAPLTASPQNLRLVKAAWGQTVLKENLRLVAGKPALLRVHLVATPNPIPLTQALSGAVYLGNAFQGNLTFTCPNPIPLATEEGNLATTCNATLPEAWVALGLRVEPRADPNNQVVETDESDNALTLNPSVGPGTALFLTVVPVVHQGQTASVPGFSQTLWRVWPLKETPYTTRAPYTFSGTLSGQDANAWSRLLDELRALRQVDGSGRYLRVRKGGLHLRHRRDRLHRLPRGGGLGLLPKRSGGDGPRARAQLRPGTRPLRHQRRPQLPLRGRENRHLGLRPGQRRPERPGPVLRPHGLLRSSVGLRLQLPRGPKLPGEQPSQTPVPPRRGPSLSGGMRWSSTRPSG